MPSTSRGSRDGRSSSAARAGETLLAINHKQYPLDDSMCVIADAERPIGLAGVMGGADSEVTTATRDLLLESAIFSSMSIRSTARKLNLHSDASYRFERALDPEGVDWASRRCAELILDLAGGELADGLVDVATPAKQRPPITLRDSQLRRVLGIDVPAAEARRIVLALGCRQVPEREVPGKNDSTTLTVAAPSWRADLEREIDLVEEVARIHGYDKIPENVRVPMGASHRAAEDRVVAKARHVLSAAGFDEAMTLARSRSRGRAHSVPGPASRPCDRTCRCSAGPIDCG